MGACVERVTLRPLRLGRARRSRACHAELGRAALRRSFVILQAITAVSSGRNLCSAEKWQTLYTLFESPVIFARIAYRNFFRIIARPSAHGGSAGVCTFAFGRSATRRARATISAAPACAAASTRHATRDRSTNPVIRSSFDFGKEMRRSESNQYGPDEVSHIVPSIFIFISACG